jgi:HEPN domain-containing protein
VSCVDAREPTHPEALYCAAQTIEKYLKAILVARTGNPHRDQRHDLVKLAHAVAAQAPEFAAQEFIGLCKQLQPFAIAGRYPDSNYAEWSFSLELLTFLDGFVAHCRHLIDLPPDLPDALNWMLRDELRLFASNEVMRAARVAVTDNNHLFPSHAEGS